jgi:hypothetical protein
MPLLLLLLLMMMIFFLVGLSLHHSALPLCCMLVFISFTRDLFNLSVVRVVQQLLPRTTWLHNESVTEPCCTQAGAVTQAMS